MLKKIIENYVERNNIKNYNLIPKYWTLNDWNTNHTLLLGNTIAFIYDFHCLGIINNIPNVILPFFVLTSNNTIAEEVDYKNIIKYKDVSNAIEASSDFISIHQNRINIDYDLTHNIFATIYKAHIKYYSLTKLK